MAAVSVSRITCCQLRPPAPSREGGSTTTARPLLRRACVAAAACVVVAGAIVDGGGGGAAIAREMAGGGGAPHVDAVVVQQRAPVVARWSDRRQCPPWHANSLENIVPENLPRPYARRRFNGVTAPPTAGPALDGSGAAAAASASPDAVIPFLTLRSSGMGCFSL